MARGFGLSNLPTAASGFMQGYGFVRGLQQQDRQNAQNERLMEIKEETHEQATALNTRKIDEHDRKRKEEETRRALGGLWHTYEQGGQFDQGLIETVQANTGVDVVALFTEQG